MGAIKVGQFEDPWVPIILIDDTDFKSEEGAKVVGDFTIKYADSGDTTLSAAMSLSDHATTGNWKNIGNGIYRVQFTDTEMTELGLFEYHVEVTGCLPYYGLLDVCSWGTETADGHISLIETDAAAILVDTYEIGTAGAGLTDLGGMSTGMKAEVESEVNDALVADGMRLDHLVGTADSDDVVDNSIIAKLATRAYGTADWSDFDNTTDSLQAIRDRGDQAWRTGSGAGATASYTEDTNWTRTEGDNDGGTASDTTTVDGTYFSTGETSSGTYLEVDVTFSITDGEYAQTFDVWGYYVGGGSHYIRVMAYNYTDSNYEEIGVIGLGSVVQRYEYNFTPDHTDTTNDEVKIKFLHYGTGVPAHVLHIDKAQVNTIAPVENDGSGLTSIPWNAAWDTEVESECTDALIAYDPPTDTEMVAAFTEIKGATWDSSNTLEEIHDDVAVVDGIVDAILVDTGATIPGTITTLQTDITSIDEQIDLDAGSSDIGIAVNNMNQVGVNIADIDAGVLNEIEDQVDQALDNYHGGVYLFKHSKRFSDTQDGADKILTGRERWYSASGGPAGDNGTELDPENVTNCIAEYAITCTWSSARSTSYLTDYTRTLSWAASRP